MQISLTGMTTVEYLTSLLLDEADAYFKRYTECKERGDFNKAISIYTVADRLLDRIRTEQSDVQSKLFWRRDNHRYMNMPLKHAMLPGVKRMRHSTSLRKAALHCLTTAYRTAVPG